MIAEPLVIIIWQQYSHHQYSPNITQTADISNAPITSARKLDTKDVMSEKWFYVMTSFF